MDVVIELARHAQRVGADYIVVHAPVLHFFKAQDQTVLNYYRTIAAKVDIGIALWSHPDSGYVMSPQLCDQLADIENVVAIKYSVARPMYTRADAARGRPDSVSTASEEEWFDNIVELGWKLYLCSSPPYLLQSASDRRMRTYTDLAFAGRIAEARARARQPQSGARRAAVDAAAGKAACASEILAGTAGPGRRCGASAAAGTDGGGAGGDPPRVRGLRPAESAAAQGVTRM